MIVTAERDDAVLLTVCNLAGHKFCARREFVLGEELTLVREPYNPHDLFAVRLDDAKGRKVGYVPGKSGDSENKLVSHLMDKGCRLSAIVRRLADPVHVGVYLHL